MRRPFLHPDLHTSFARERLRHDHAIHTTDAEGTASLASECTAIRVCREADCCAVCAEVVPLLEGRDEELRTAA